MGRTIVKTDVEACGCFVQVITDTWMGQPITYENPVICKEHW